MIILYFYKWNKNSLIFKNIKDTYIYIIIIILRDLKLRFYVKIIAFFMHAEMFIFTDNRTISLYSHLPFAYQDLTVIV